MLATLEVRPMTPNILRMTAVIWSGAPMSPNTVLDHPWARRLTIDYLATTARSCSP
ncbi:MAG: hypothetical protein ACOH2F_01500 [Cellulomonas sp.]